MPADAKHPAVPKDAKLKQLLSDIAFKTNLAELVRDLDSAQANLKRQEAPGLGPSRSVDIFRRYYQRECEKAQLRVEVFTLPNEIAKCRRAYEIARSPLVRQQHEEQFRRAGRSTSLRPNQSGSSWMTRKTSPPEPPEADAQRKLDSAIRSLKSKKRRLREITSHDAEWKALIGKTPEPRQGEELQPLGQLSDPASAENHTRQRIQAFIEKTRDAGHRIKKTNIWQVAGYKDRTEFERFQREDKRATSGSKSKFNRVLNMSPEMFMRKLANQRST